MKRRFLLTFIAVDTLIVALAVGLFFMLSASYRGYSEPVVLNIEPGTSSQKIAEDLEAQRIVRSKWLFLAARAVRMRSTLMAGEYGFSEPMSVWQIYDQIAAGKVLQHPITFAEGLTRFEMAGHVANLGFATREEFLAECEKTDRIRDLAPEAKNLEGFLYPETYQMTRPFSAAKLVDMMVKRFRAVYGELAQTHKSEMSAFELVTLASMVEKETGVGGERKLVSSVFHNRLKRSMLLQCDPTVIYGLVVQNRYKGQLTRDDLAVAHPYNTYVRAGLPPGPIANPGRASLEAALNPADSNYLYFVADAKGSGGHIFSESLQAHNVAVGAYRRNR